MLGGVVAGLAERANIDVTVARLLAVLAFCFSAGAVTVAYVAAWILMPAADSQTAPIARWQHQPPPHARWRGLERLDQIGSALMRDAIRSRAVK